MWECNWSDFKLLKELQLFNRRSSQNSVALMRSQATRGIVPLGLAAMLGLGAVNWIGISAIAPTVAQAYTARVNVAINRIEGESYLTLVRRAEIVARAAAQRSFDGDILVTDVAVIVSGQNEGFVAPILSLEVSRPNWKRLPDPQRWVRYYPNAQALLQFETVGQAPSNQAPVPTPTPSPTPTPPNAPSAPEQPGNTQPGNPSPEQPRPENDVPSSPPPPDPIPPDQPEPNGIRSQP